MFIFTYESHVFVLDWAFFHTMAMISAYNRFQMIFIHKKIKRSDGAERRGSLRFPTSQMSVVRPK